jgi:hypothetical protein
VNQLSADFPALISCSVDVDIPLAGFELRNLRIAQCRRPLDGAGEVAGKRHDHPGIRTGVGRTVDMRCDRGTAEAGIFDGPCQRLGRGIERRRGGAFPRARDPRTRGEIRCKFQLIGVNRPADEKYREETQAQPSRVALFLPSRKDVMA